MSIDVGDTVMLIDACCDRTRGSIGWIGRVEQMAVVLSPRACDFCEFASTDSWQAGITIEQFGYVPVRWLKKIEPPASVPLTPTSKASAVSDSKMLVTLDSAKPPALKPLV